MDHTDKYSQHISIIWPILLNSFSLRLEKKVIVGSSPVAITQSSYIAPVLKKAFLVIHATSWCRLTLNAHVI